MTAAGSSSRAENANCKHASAPRKETFIFEENGACVERDRQNSTVFCSAIPQKFRKYLLFPGIRCIMQLSFQYWRLDSNEPH